MQLHEIKPKFIRKAKKRVGRGGKKGTYAGRGLLGQKARAGRRFAPVVRELVKAYPKLRGLGFQGRAEKFVAILNVEEIEKKFEAGSVINPKVLVEKHIVDTLKGELPIVKILGNGELTKAVIVEQCQVSKSAKTKIEKVGGKVQ